MSEKSNLFVEEPNAVINIFTDDDFSFTLRELFLSELMLPFGEWCEKNGIDEDYMNDVLDKREPLTQKILYKVGKSEDICISSNAFEVMYNR